MRKWIWGAALFVLGAGCGRDAEKKPVTPKVVAGFDFEIAIEPATFVPAAMGPVKIASDGDAESNPPGTVQLYTPNDSLTWLDGPDGDVFGFDVELTNFYARELCALRVVVDSITPATGRVFVSDDRGLAYAGGVTGAGVWAYGDVAAQKSASRRWEIKLRDKGRFTLRGRVLADDEACGAAEN